MLRTLTACVFVLTGLSGALVGAESADSPALMNPNTDPPGLAPGAEAPDGVVVDVDGKQVSMADLYASGPVVVTFYRGGWCPFCTKALRDWEQAVTDVAEAGGTFVAITPETVDHASNTREKFAPSVTVLSDPDGRVAMAFRVAFEMEPELQTKYKGYGVDLASRNASGRWELPAPATFVIGRDGVVRWAFADWDYRKRADPQEVIAAVRSAAAR